MVDNLSQSITANAWHAIYVRSKHEKSVYEVLQLKGIKSSLPLKTVYRQWSDRKKKIQIPLFRGYVFVNINIQNEKLEVLQTDGVVKFIAFGGRNITIPEAQMYWLDKLSTASNTEHEHEFPVKGEVEVMMGPFKGIQGRIKKKQSETRLVVWFDAIMQGVSVEIDPTWLTPVRVQKNISAIAHV